MLNELIKMSLDCIKQLKFGNVNLLGECMALWGEPNEPSIQHHAGLHLYAMCR